MDSIINLVGYIAIQCDWQTDWNKPEQFRVTYTSGKRYPVKYWEHLIGREVSWTGNTAIARQGSNWCYLPTDNGEWEKQIQTRPVEKPRKGKNYDWEWRQGRWEKRYR